LAFIYWIFCYSMSLASRRLEQRWLGCGGIMNYELWIRGVGELWIMNYELWIGEWGEQIKIISWRPATDS
jgi:hypothetical protein